MAMGVVNYSREGKRPRDGACQRTLARTPKTRSNRKVWAAEQQSEIVALATGNGKSPPRGFPVLHKHGKGGTGAGGIRGGKSLRYYRALVGGEKQKKKHHRSYWGGKVKGNLTLLRRCTPERSNEQGGRGREKEVERRGRQWDSTERKKVACSLADHLVEEQCVIFLPNGKNLILIGKPKRGQKTNKPPGVGLRGPQRKQARKDGEEGGPLYLSQQG